MIERPGYGYQLARRLEERFGSSAFAPSGVYSALDQLSRDELVRAAGEVGSGPARRAAPRMIYEATDEGVQHFEAWMLGSSPAPPLRDELHMKIALCRPRNVPALIDMIYGQELACMARLRELKLVSEHESAGDGQEWSRLMRILVRDAEIASWKARIEWLQNARELLERLLEDPARVDPRGAPAASERGSPRERAGRLRAL
ncbi:MAG TPA: helix-turn-helix transcriptional regulator [Solirubrobacteraceae bacterium]|nr:helix-turn-helix transcriptional regulator [Solirubrobacteraceae bacterium]